MTAEQVIGVGVLFLVLLDVFLTVLYARAGTGLLAPLCCRALWSVLRALAGRSRRRGAVLSFAGPAIVVGLIFFWALGLIAGAALVIHPELGGGIRPSSGGAASDFVTAMLVAGNSLSIVGAGAYAPQTPGTRLLFLVNSVIGMSVVSLVLSYLVQVYSALRERNALALTIGLMTGGTGDAARMLAALLPDGEGYDATGELGDLARGLLATKEAHHFYPLLFYFRFEEPLYAVSRFAFVLLDLTTLIGSALDQRRYRALAGSAAVMSLRAGALLLLNTLERVSPLNRRSFGDGDDEEGARRSYFAAMEILTRAGVATEPNGVETYLLGRRDWEPRVRRIAPALGYALEDVDVRRP